jgi:hypothetical protein
MRNIPAYLSLLIALAGNFWPAWSAPATAATVSPLSTVTVATDGITYIAQAGDTLLSIASRFTSRRDNWMAIGQYNHIGKDSNIPIGTAIVIPADLLADEPIEGKVVAMSGAVIGVAADGKTMPIGLGSKVNEGMQIQTSANGFLTIALPDGSRISLPSNSRVKLSKLRVTRYTQSPRTEILLLKGRIESRVMPLASKKGRYEIHTPFSVAGVRGTHFRVSTMDNRAGNEVLDGSVAVGAADTTDESVSLAKGKGNIATNSKVGPPVDLLPAPAILLPASQTYTTAQFNIIPLPQASAYRVQISTDADAQNIIAEGLSSTHLVQVANVPNGDYFMHVTAIDKYGLEGFPRTQSFTLRSGTEQAAQQDKKLHAPYVEKSDSKTITFRWPAQPGQHFQLQIARDADFTWQLFCIDADVPQAQIPRLEFGTYYARVQIVNKDGKANTFSPIQAFIVTDHWVINDGNPIVSQATQSSSSR